MIFLSYSHKDERDKDRLVTQIKVLERNTPIDLWSDERIKVGGEWKSEIDEAMASAKAAVLLITANYLTSNFILDVEVPGLLESHKAAGLNIFPVISRACPWEEVPWLAKLNVLPRGGKPVWRSGGRHVDKELSTIARAIARVSPPSDKTVAPSSTWITGSHLPYGTYDEALEAVDIELRRFNPSFTIKLHAIARLIRLTISYGSPIYNRGGIRECARIYLHVSKQIVTLVENSRLQLRTAFMSADGPTEARRKLLLRDKTDRDCLATLAYVELKEAATPSMVTTENADAVAWNIRHVFDELLFVERAGKTIEVLTRSFGDRNERISKMIAVVIDAAISQAGLIYEEGSNRERNWIRGSAAIYIYAAQLILSRLKAFPNRNADAVVKILERRIGPKLIVFDDAFKTAWDLRQAFDQVLVLITSTSTRGLEETQQFIGSVVD